MLPNELFLGIHMYGVMIAIGLLLCFLVVEKYCKILKLEQDFIDFIFYNGVASVGIGFVTASLFQGLYDYIENPSAGFKLDGMTFIGGLLGGIATFIIIYCIFRKKYKNRLIDMLTVAPCGILIAHACGRVGCFFAGCCYGIESDSVFGVKFPNLSHKVLPTQLYEATFLFILFALTSYLLVKKKFKHNMSLYLIVYGIWRFLLEFIRDDSRGQFIGSITPSQFWSICFAIAGVVLYFILKKLYVVRDKELEELRRKEQLPVKKVVKKALKTSDGQK